MAILLIWFCFFSISQTVSFDRLKEVSTANQKLLMNAKTPQERIEYGLRNEFLKRLIFRFDKYLNGSEREFIIKQIDDIATIEASDPHGVLALRKFAFNLSTALQTQAEKSENTGTFIEGYMKFSTISNPKDPAQYIRVRSYSNGDEWYTAKAVRPDMVGEIVEKKLRQIDSTHFKLKSPIR